MTQEETDAPQPVLSRLERNVIALAIREAGNVRREARGIVARVVRWIGRTMGDDRGSRPLGSIRLEALRRFVDLVRRGGVASAAMRSDLAEFGYSPVQLAAVVELAR